MNPTYFLETIDIAALAGIVLFAFLNKVRSKWFFLAGAFAILIQKVLFLMVHVSGQGLLVRDWIQLFLLSAGYLLMIFGFKEGLKR